MRDTLSSVQEPTEAAEVATRLRNSCADSLQVALHATIEATEKLLSTSVGQKLGPAFYVPPKQLGRSGRRTLRRPKRQLRRRRVQRREVSRNALSGVLERVSLSEIKCLSVIYLS